MFLWIKAFHIMAMVAWFAGIFYLPRLFVYHADAKDSLSHERFCLMERRLYRGIMIPSMLLTLALGIALIFYNPKFYLHAAWMHAKLSSVIMLIAYHHLCGYYQKQFAKQQNTRSALFYRVFNEVPTLLLIAIVIFVVVKPF